MNRNNILALVILTCTFLTGFFVRGLFIEESKTETTKNTVITSKTTIDSTETKVVKTKELPTIEVEKIVPRVISKKQIHKDELVSLPISNPDSVLITSIIDTTINGTGKLRIEMLSSCPIASINFSFTPIFQDTSTVKTITVKTTTKEETTITETKTEFDYKSAAIVAGIAVIVWETGKALLGN